MTTTTLPSPDHILDTGIAFWKSKALLSAVEIGVFSALADGPLSAEQLRQRLQLHPRAVPDFTDTLVALGFLEREGEGALAAYANTAATQRYLDARSPHYVGGGLEMANARLYRFWGDLSDGLRSGRPQNELKHGGASMFEALYADDERLEQFMGAMSGLSAANFTLLAERFDFSRFSTLADTAAPPASLRASSPRAIRTCSAARSTCRR